MLTVHLRLFPVVEDRPRLDYPVCQSLVCVLPGLGSTSQTSSLESSSDDGGTNGDTTSRINNRIKLTTIPL